MLQNFSITLALLERKYVEIIFHLHGYSKELHYIMMNEETFDVHFDDIKILHIMKL